MKSIFFFNHYHNGDIYHSRAFVKPVAESHESDVFYGTRCPDIILKDISVKTAHSPQLHDKVQFHETPDMLFVNTWIGSWFDKGLPNTNECTLRFAYEMWKHIYDSINERLNTNYSVEVYKQEDYLPEFDYTQFDTSNVSKWVESNSGKKILFCNSPVHSGQCDYNGDMAYIIEEQAKKYPDTHFIVTNPINSDLTNIVTTDSITKRETCDLVEISYLAQSCDLIVGRNSGPFCFSSTKKNLMDETKMFYSFGVRETDNFAHGLEVKAKNIFKYYTGFQDLQDDIKELTNELHSS